MIREMTAPPKGDDPYVSFVVVSRNDNHGGDLTTRTQTFINGLASLCWKFRLPAELILVEWNPPKNAPYLQDVFRWPSSGGFLDYRLVQVPPTVHARLQNAEHLPLFQMIGKNVGIRRARGKFVLATNLDLLFSDALGDFLASRSLQSGRYYRVDRFDSPTAVLEVHNTDRQLQFCAENVLRVNTKVGTLHLSEWQFYRQHRLLWKARDFRRKAMQRLQAAFFPWSTLEDLWQSLYPPRAIRGLARRAYALVADGWMSPAHYLRFLRRFLLVPRLHTNACGDFTLLSREDWFKLRGYPELEIFSWHIDSLFLYQASSAGMEEVTLPMPIYHIEHTSGWNPDDGDKLWKRLHAQNIPYLSNQDLAIYREALFRSKATFLFNSEHWGLVANDLPEVRPEPKGIIVLPAA
jgi:hypothetical protein